MSSGLVLLVTGIGLADSVNPVPIALAVVYATRSLRALLEFTVASFAVTFGAGLLLTAIPGDALHDFIRGISPHTVHVGQVIGGVTALAVSAWLLLHQTRQHEQAPRWVSDSRPDVVGGVIAAIDLPTALPYVGVIVAIVSATHVWHQRAILVLIYNVCYYVPLIAIVAVRAAMGDRGRPALNAIRDFVERWGPRIFGVAALVIGIVLLWKGIDGLSTA